MPQSRDQKRHAVKRRHQFSLKTAYERIDYMEKVAEELLALEQGRAHLDSRDNYHLDVKEDLDQKELPE